MLDHLLGEGVAYAAHRGIRISIARLERVIREVIELAEGFACVVDQLPVVAPDHLANVDIAATIAVGAGEEASGMDGRSFLPVIAEGRAIRDSLYIETYLPTYTAFANRVDGGDGKLVPVGVRRHGVLMPPWKYIATEHYPLQDAKSGTPSPEVAAMVAGIELYNLDADPLEGASRDQSDDTHAILAEIAGILAAYLEAEQGDPGDGSRFAPDESHVEKLRSLGYVE